jgi:AraC family transcriptional regulator, regulatory protein of adaptative response / DNA-3-methyladenine glycosylase II
MTSPMHLDSESCYRAVKSRDRRFDGVFYTAVRTTGIYCRPSCPARTPSFANVTFHPTAAAAQSAGYRACKRCLPDATPGSPDWDVAADAAGRAMRLIGDGVVDREGVEGLAARVGYTPRHLTRILTHELGAGPLALARAKRAQTARVLLETTELGVTDVAFAAGFSSVRQFNDTMREVYASTPTQLRGRRGRGSTGGTVQLRLAVRTPFAGRALLRFLASHAVPGVEAADATTYTRSLLLPHGPALVTLELTDAAETGMTAFVPATFRLTDVRDLSAAVERVRRLLDADCDPVAVIEAFTGDPLLGPLVAALPGLRVPGAVDGDELAVRTVLGQQVTVAAGRTAAAKLVRAHGDPLPALLGVPGGGPTHTFPTAARLAALDPESLPMPAVRRRALTSLCRELADRRVRLDRGADRDAVRRSLLAIAGIGPWTADYVAMRALGHPDVFLATDIGIRDALRALGRDPAEATFLAADWSPWRSYAQLYLWHTLEPEEH